MKTIQKLITFYISDDGEEHLTEKQCKKQNIYLEINTLHKKLIECDFHAKFRHTEEHYSEPRTLGNKFISKNLDSNLSYVLTSSSSRCGNYGEIIRYKKHGSNIVLLKEINDDGHFSTKYLASIPSNWIKLDLEILKVEVDKYLSERKVFKKIITNTQTIEYVRI